MGFVRSVFCIIHNTKRGKLSTSKKIFFYFMTTISCRAYCNTRGKWCLWQHFIFMLLILWSTHVLAHLSEPWMWSLLRSECCGVFSCTFVNSSKEQGSCSLASKQKFTANSSNTEDKEKLLNKEKKKKRNPSLLFFWDRPSRFRVPWASTILD